MADSKNKNPDNLSIKSRLAKVIKTKEAEERALKKMIDKLAGASAKITNQNNSEENN